MAKGKTDVTRLWVYVRDDVPFADTDPPAALFHYSRDRRGEHPQAHLASWSGIFQADAYGGYGELYRDARGAGPVFEAGCFEHARRKFFDLADVEGTARKNSRGERTGTVYPIALEGVRRLDALFDIERAINGKSAAERLAERQELSAPPSSTRSSRPPGSTTSTRRPGSPTSLPALPNIRRPGSTNCCRVTGCLGSRSRKPPDGRPLDGVHHALRRDALRRRLDVIEKLAEDMAPENGRLSVIHSLDDAAEAITAFTRRGLDYLDELLDHRRSDFMDES